MKCIECGKDFDAVRSTAKFCSGGCRLAFHRGGLSVTNEVSVTDMDIACRVAGDVFHEGYLDVEQDLGLDMKKDLGITAWTDNGIFIRPDITVRQVQNIAKLVAAKHNRKATFNEAIL